MVVYAGNWDRPCLDCGKTPADGVQFRGYPKPGDDRFYRKGSCIECLRLRVKEHDAVNPEQAKARSARAQANRDWAADHTRRKDRDPDYNRRRNIKAMFGISLEEYEQRFYAQGGTCDICSAPLHLKGENDDPRAVLDHNHATSVIRSFLCGPCNVLIGMSRENEYTLLNAVSYLSKFRCERAAI